MYLGIEFLSAPTLSVLLVLRRPRRSAFRVTPRHDSALIHPFRGWQKLQKRGVSEERSSQRKQVGTQQLGQAPVVIR